MSTTQESGQDLQDRKENHDLVTSGVGYRYNPAGRAPQPRVSPQKIEEAPATWQVQYSTGKVLNTLSISRWGSIPRG